MEMLPDIWVNQTGVQLHSLTTFISQDSEFVDWKKYLILASSPLPMPSRDELFNTLSRFMNIDVEKTGLVSEQQFLQVYTLNHFRTLATSHKPSTNLQFHFFKNENGKTKISTFRTLIFTFLLY
jgi:Ca2+-binding EF-hand superfamily protein